MVILRNALIAFSAIKADSESPKYNGYIIEFEEEPIIVKKTKLDKEAKEKDPLSDFENNQ